MEHMFGMAVLNGMVGATGEGDDLIFELGRAVCMLTWGVAEEDEVGVDITGDDFIGGRDGGKVEEATTFSNVEERTLEVEDAE